MNHDLLQDYKDAERRLEAALDILSNSEVEVQAAYRDLKRISKKMEEWEHTNSS